MKKKILQENLNNLEEKYKQVYQQLNNTLNNGDKDTLKRQIQEIEAEMTDVENQLNKLTPSILIPQTLIQILTSLHETAISSITKAYQASCPQGFIQQADTLEDILDILQDIPKGNKDFTYIEEFIAHLSIDSQVPQSFSQGLQEWGKKYINNFDQLIRDIQSDDNLDNQETKSYLLIQVKPKTDKLDRFYIYAWLIPDIRHYKPEVGDGFKQVSVSKLAQKTFTLQNIPKIVDLLLEDISSEFLGKLTVEFFLPYKLLNHTVDSFIRVEFGTAETIGKKYKVVVRANERLQRNYPYKGIWFDKWQKLKQVYNSQCKQGLVSGNHCQEVIRKKLDKANGIILINIPKSTSIETIFSYILITATPIALWLRKELENQNVTQQSAINSLLDCCIQELPDRVKEQRLDAPESHNDHIGHHISLVWEDPERLTPDAGYFYSTPQSAS